MNLISKFFNDRKSDVILSAGGFHVNPHKKFTDEQFKVASKKSDELNREFNTDWCDCGWLGYIEDSFISLYEIRIWLQKKFPGCKIVRCSKNEEFYAIGIAFAVERKIVSENVQMLIVSKKTGRVSCLSSECSPLEWDDLLGMDLKFDLTNENEK